MNCRVVQRRLMSTDDTSWIPADVEAHLAFCSACQECQRELARIERHVACLPVPGSGGKRRLLAKILGTSSGHPKPDTAASAKPDRTESVQPSPARSLPFPIFKRPYALMSGVAAGLLAGGVGLWSIMGEPPKPEARANPTHRDPLVASLLQTDLRLASTQLPRERVELLSDMAEELYDAAKLVVQADEAEPLDGLARLYDQVVREGIMKHAEEVAIRERRPVLTPIADRLLRAARNLERLSTKLPAEQSRPLLTIVAAARVGNRHLFGLLPEDRS